MIFDLLSLILGIDTSCDETSAAVVNGCKVMSNVVFSQVDLHKEWGGVVPSLAKRLHQEKLPGVVDLALKKSRVSWDNIEAIAVTYGPGLAIALEVGIAYAKELAKKYDRPLIAINHMEGHIASVMADSKFKIQITNNKSNSNNKIQTLCLLISGGHTELVVMKEFGKYEVIGATRDDAAGEAMDKAAKILGLGYPGGAVLEQMAKMGDKTKYDLPRPMLRVIGYDFSFSGLKTALRNMVSDKQLTKQEVCDYAASFQEAVCESLWKKTFVALKGLSLQAQRESPFLLVAGGVAANNYLRQYFRKRCKILGVQAIFPEKKYCTDNAAMIGIAAGWKLEQGEFVTDLESLDRIPNLTL